MSLLYHSEADVKAELKNIDIQASGTIIITSQVAGYMAATEARVNSIISRKYVLPITDALYPEAFAIIKTICIKLSAGRCEQILRRNSAEANTAGDGTRLRSLIKEAEDMLEDILKDNLLLTGATRFKAISSNVSFDTSGQASNSPTIQKGIKQW